MKRLARMTLCGTIAAALGTAFALGVGGTAALAADMAIKAPPPPAPVPSNWHGFLEVGYEFGQMNEQGQAVYKNGDYNIVGGAALDLYSSKTGFINSWSVGGLGIADFAASSTLGPNDSLWANNNPTAEQSALYFILSANTSITFGQVWTLTDSYFHLVGSNTFGGVYNGLDGPGTGTCTQTHGPAGPPADLNLGCGDVPSWSWNELKLSLNDGALTKWPLSFNPYVTWYYEIFPSGNAGILTTTTSAACFSCNSEGTDFIIGMTPKINMQPYWAVPVTLTAPTWVTVGPTSFWSGNAGFGPGSGCVGPPTTNCSSGNVGTFSTGLTASWAFTSIPAQWGHWSAKAGFQYYDIVNKALIADNTVTWGSSFTKSDIVVGFLGLGVGF
jgi:hypothetical protein